MVTTVLNLVDLYLKNNPGPHYAAFDADGTLWANDVGENFFQYQIDHCNLPALKNIDPWKHYLDLKKQHPPTAYLWLAQICKNAAIGDVEKWALEAAKKFKPEAFPEQKELIRSLQERGITVYVVSASVEWAVTGALLVAGFENVKALGVKTKVLGRIVSDEQNGSITWREGKRDALLAMTALKPPMLSCGNTLGDQHLLEMSKAIKIAVQSQKSSAPHEHLYNDEQGLLKLAQEKKWLSFPLYKS